MGTLSPLCTSAAERSAETISNSTEHVWEVEHVRGTALDTLFALWVGTHCDFGGRKCRFARRNDVEGRAFYTIVPWDFHVSGPTKVRTKDAPRAHT